VLVDINPESGNFSEFRLEQDANSVS